MIWTVGNNCFLSFFEFLHYKYVSNIIHKFRKVNGSWLVVRIFEAIPDEGTTNNVIAQ